MSKGVVYITIPELAERWGISIKTLYNWLSRDSNSLPPIYKFGSGKRCVRFRLDEVEQIEAQSKVIH
ncbi:MAG: DNA-binding protein [Gammaproteobacteria bacterium]|nr:MAG: DNA-binding protein [Gammaproteobacteria bacterium]